MDVEEREEGEEGHVRGAEGRLGVVGGEGGAEEDEQEGEGEGGEGGEGEGEEGGLGGGGVFSLRGLDSLAGERRARGRGRGGKGRGREGKGEGEAYCEPAREILPCFLALPLCPLGLRGLWFLRRGTGGDALRGREAYYRVSELQEGEGQEVGEEGGDWIGDEGGEVQVVGGGEEDWVEMGETAGGGCGEVGNGLGGGVYGARLRFWGRCHRGEGIDGVETAGGAVEDMITVYGEMSRLGSLIHGRWLLHAEIFIGKTQTYAASLGPPCDADAEVIA